MACATEEKDRAIYSEVSDKTVTMSYVAMLVFSMRNEKRFPVRINVL
ncbi:hypothetical protein APHCRT_0840 [Anaplasma phagocytophilum str. CRT53-1]|uniref:Uncharacterized protein n=2 Tax=Anaplasma phagocytophilum TaxID=948 RepID=A0A0F3Q082_ANAPH|nr:hypothetical protein CRT38_03117 [Anaplasma phagocytophilum str. CRT38]KJV85918.1 hypothetical protein APHCRT_0840 [Anaplasma phagocytophilum str. CRT53-1]